MKTQLGARMCVEQLCLKQIEEERVVESGEKDYCCSCLGSGRCMGGGICDCHCQRSC